MKYIKISTWYLAISMFMFGILKFAKPFKSWYHVQIVNSNLGQLAYIMGIVGEISIGTLLILCLLFKEKLTQKIYRRLTNFAFITIIIMMLTGVYVHIHPNVPADVLPLKIKPPFIPIFFLLLAVTNIILSFQDRKKMF